MSIVRAWDRFWFRPADPLPLGVIRVFTGVVILYMHLIYSLDLMSLVGPRGWMDTEAVQYWRHKIPYAESSLDWEGKRLVTMPQGQPIWSAFFHLEDRGWIIATHVAFLTAMFLFTIGFATRVTAVITWFAMLSYIHRMPVFLYGADSIMNVLVLYLMIGPSGATLSVDRLLQRLWARRAGRAAPPVQPMVSANFALRLMQIQFCIIYLASGLSKLQGSAWWTGTAVWGTMANYSFAPMNWPLYLKFLTLLSEHRVLWEVIMTTGSYATLALEISFPFLVWRPNLRWLMICGSILLHTGIAVIMGLTTFSLLMLCLVLAFVPAETHHAFVAVMRNQGLKLRDVLRGKAPRVKPPAERQALAAGA